MTTCQMSVELGAYVLQALEDDETELVRRHLVECGACRDEERDLSFTASLLALLKPGDLDGLDVPDDLVPSTAGPVAGDGRGQRRPGRRTLLVVAVALTAALSVPVARVLDHPAPGSSSTVIHAADPASKVRAAVTLAAQDDGTRLHLTLSGVYPRGWCSLVAHSRDGRTDTAATWRADAKGTADVAGTTAIPTSRLSELDVVTDSGRVLVRIPVARQAT